MGTNVYLGRVATLRSVCIKGNVAMMIRGITNDEVFHSTQFLNPNPHVRYFMHNQSGHVDVLILNLFRARIKPRTHQSRLPSLLSMTRTFTAIPAAMRMKRVWMILWNWTLITSFYSKVVYPCYKAGTVV